MAKGGKQLFLLESNFNTIQLGQYAWDWTPIVPDKGGWTINLDTREFTNMGACFHDTGCKYTLART